MSESENKTESPHPFSADRPIQIAEEDRLGRRGFAESIAAALANWKGRDSLVVALYGPWGSGKTSIKNMVVETLKADPSEAPTMVEFNPWQWASQDEIAKAFFGEVGLALGHIDKTRAGKRRVVKWQAYAARLKMWSFLAGSLRKIIARFLFFLALISMAGLLSGSEYIRIGLVLVFFASLGLAGLFQWGSEFAGNFVNVLERKLAIKERGLTDTKKELSALLQQLKTPVLVIIDDIDRLSKPEIRLLFQIVKANADFSNMVYLLLFQRDIVERALDENGPMNGKEFLEKIVQVGFDIPAADRSRLEKVLFSKLDEILGGESVSKRFDNHRWGNIYFGGLYAFFDTLRDANRFVSSLSFHVSLFQGKKAFEVNPIDLIALEAIRVFEPGVYRALLAAKAELIGLDRLYATGNEAVERARKAVDALLEKADAERRQPLRELLRELFPRTGDIGYGAGFDDEWYRELRVCHRNVFDRYFQFTISEKDLSQSELEEILELVGDRERLRAKLRAVNERGLLAIALERLEAYKEKLELAHAVPFITALFDIGDELPETPPGFYVFGADIHAWRIIHFYLIREKDVAARESALGESLRATTGVYLPVDVVRHENDRQERKKEPESFLVSDAALPKLKAMCVEKIRNAAETGVLARGRWLPYILYTWRLWTTPEEPSKWVQEVLVPQGVTKILLPFVSTSSSAGMDDRIAKIHKRMALKSIEDFVPLDVVEEKVKGLDRNTLADKELEVVKLFEKAMARRRQGKPDDDWRHDDED